MSIVAQFPTDDKPEADPYLAHTPPTEDDWARLEACEMIRIMAERFSYKRVASWVRNLAAIAGEEV